MRLFEIGTSLSRSRLVVLSGGLFCWCLSLPSPVACGQTDANVDRLHQRIPWTNSALKGFPDPPPPLKLVEAFPNLKIPKLITLGAVPKSDWLLAVDHENEYAGGSRAVVFRDQVDISMTETFLETPEIVYGFAWHPQFETKRWVYVGCNGRSEELDAVATKVLRFEVKGEGPYRCDPATRTLIIEWPSNGHNGGDLAFGNDGMLYVSAGDGTSDSDTLRNGQNLATLPGSLLRIDIGASSPAPPLSHDSPSRDPLTTTPSSPDSPSRDPLTTTSSSHDSPSRDPLPQPTANLNQPAYRIPADNPFVGLAYARGEIWAYGLRNPWRITFDARSNQLWVGNNGQDLWESVYLVKRGANYGWSINESNHPFHTQQDHGPVEISPATVEHHHSQSRSLTGGHVYHGTEFPELQGAYIYGDYSTGNVWAVRHDGQQIDFQQLIARSRVQISDFDFDSRGELLVADHAGSIFRLARNTEEAAVDFPKLLSQTGLFSDVTREQPVAGVMPYSINSPLWSDGAIKKRWMAVPGNATIAFAARGSWDFPEGSVLVKSFAFPTAETSANRLVETRLLAKQQGEWYGYSYRWKADQSDAELVEGEGREEILDWVVEEGKGADLRWRYPSRTECMVCHSRAAKFVLGLSVEQMQRTQTYHTADGSPVDAPQLQTLAGLGLFGESWKMPDEIDAQILVDPYDVKQDIDRRARSYLHTNCASCHVEAGGGNSKIKLDYFTAPEKMNLLEADPLHGSLDIAGAKLLKAGAPEQSILHARVARRGTGQMPPLATHRVDAAAVELIRQWIGK